MDVAHLVQHPALTEPDNIDGHSGNSDYYHIAMASSGRNESLASESTDPAKTPVGKVIRTEISKVIRTEVSKVIRTEVNKVSVPRQRVRRNMSSGQRSRRPEFVGACYKNMNTAHSCNRRELTAVSRAKPAAARSLLGGDSHPASAACSLEVEHAGLESGGGEACCQCRCCGGGDGDAAAAMCCAMPDCPPARECEGREGPGNDTASAQVGRHTAADCQHCAKGHSQTHSCQNQPCCHSGRSEGVKSSESGSSKNNNINSKSNTESTNTLNSKLVHSVHLEALGGRRSRSTHHLNRAPYRGVPSWLWSPGCRVATILILTLLTLLQLVPWSAAIVYRKQMSGRVITTRYGKVRGILVEFPNRHLKPVEAFFGLKYADLEKGNMRFMPPKNPKEQWTKIRAAIAQQPSCPQLMRHERDYQNAVPEGRVTHLRNITPFLTEQIEDCLTLNLYVPIPKWNETTPMPVMVFIHGESYDSGTGNAYDGSVLSSFGDVIVVTLNYRLGVLGFLTTLDQSAMGNLGLLDITQALLWLQENIASFYGDPKRVTLFGHGHGASLVNLLLVSPFTSEGRGPFFQQAILQSGSALSTWSVSYDPLWCTEKLAIGVNCSAFIGHSGKLVNCLRQRSVAELLSAAPQAPKYYSCFAPAIDEWTVLPTQVEKLIKERKSKFASVPVMFGITKNEAYSYLKQQEIHKGISDPRKTQIIRTYVQNVFRYHRQKIYEILDHQYTDWTQPSNHMSNRNNILELLSDGQYVAPLIKTANYHAETADTYLYAFSYSTQSESGSQTSEDVQGIHGDELPYVFGSPLVDGLSPFPSSYTSAEKMMSEAVMTYWTNFAKSGDPNVPCNQTSVHGGKVHNRYAGMRWPKYDKTSQQYMQISRRPAVRHHYRGQKLAMWLDLIPKINVEDGSDPTSHLLSNSDNQTTFDDYHRLIRPFDNVFPSPPPMPPISPTMSYRNDGPSTPTFTMDKDNGQPGERGGYRPVRPGGREGGGGGSSDDDTATVDEAEEGVTPEDWVLTTAHAPVASKTEGGGEHLTNSLSITVAVGCTLLFLNILIFAAVYYQRVRIRKMRESRREPEDPDDVKLSRKLEREANRNCVMGPETDSLMSEGTATGGAGVGGGASYTGAGLRGGTEDSPSREPGVGGVVGGGVGGGVGAGSHSGTLGRRSPPQNCKKASSGTLSRSSADTASSAAYNYTAVPTHTTSPLHRSQVHHHPHPPQPSGMANSTTSSPPSGSSSLRSYPAPAHAHPPMAMNTFGNNVHSLGKGTRLGGGVGGVGRGGGGVGGGSRGSEAADTGLYQVINKAAPSQGRDGSGGNASNAITIV